MFIICSIFLMLAAPAKAEILTGTIRVIDADTFDIGAPTNIRLLGIDAAENDQTCHDAAGTILRCGALATDATRRLYGGRRAHCAVQAYDRYGRALAACSVSGKDVNGDLVRRGFARTYRDDRTYLDEQSEAVRVARGLWAFEMIDPADWRAGKRRARATD
ncbi:Endonuclease YncB, thermonuclease family [Jannaschia faecimaris]|uniref:Endonuclease YncB, thermonuclease family n=1 Tax=Jannaschia faecimaris TaxID=1244108 RepID=A0A1H3Q8S2_9RHOB|nr:thermonuclease family protein [Jannaschia faecimaris]SDZ09796.1 Endonuclease YncB, thermonuclease family [Jannaschia faecimaris]